MQLFAGSSGFSYKEWKGHFYPAELDDGEMLAYYASRLPAVEINNTFYRLPKAELLDRWAAAVPGGFRFALKASRRITHQGKLEGQAETLGYLWRSAAHLGDHLGPILFQLPPYLRKNRDRLAGFLAELPAGMRAVFEFRHASWLDDEVRGLLADHHSTLCASDEEDAACDLCATSDLGYLRLRREAYEPHELTAWASRIRAMPWREVYVFFKHEETAPGLAQAFREAFA